MAEKDLVETSPVPESVFIGGVELESPQTKSVLSIPPGTLQPTTTVIRYGGLLWVRHYGFAMSDKRAWIPVSPHQILDIK